MIPLATLSFLIWLYLLAAHGRFWSTTPTLSTPSATKSPPPLAGEGWVRAPAPGANQADGQCIDVVIPARDEAASIHATLTSLLAQTHPNLRITLVDDQSTDGTATLARAIPDPRLTVLDGQPRPHGWSGKLWALHQGVATTTAPLILLTDADIVHDPRHLAVLLEHLHGRDMVSGMVALRCHSIAERALVPAFVFFFQLLYPFARVNDPAWSTAAAAGGVVLLRRAALDRIGGIASLRGALIDDVTLASRLKPHGPIWLAHDPLAHSVRPYPGAADIWRMVARTAYVQLRFSPALLLATTLALALVWLVPPALALFGHGPARWIAALAWLAAMASYLPTLRRVRQSLLWALALPAIAGFYMAVTVGSALDHHRGRGVRWKNRAYQGAGP